MRGNGKGSFFFLRKRKGLVLFDILLSFDVSGLGTNLLVVLLEGSQILSGLRELSFLHTFTNVPMNECSLGVHQIELVIDTSEHLSDGGGVGDHADGSLNLGQVTTWNNSWWLVVDTTLESSWGPVNELDGSLGLDGGNGGVDILWNNIT